MCNKKMFSMMMAAVMTVGVSAGTVSAEAEYEPVTITLNLQRSGLGENVPQARKFLSFWNRDRLFLTCQKKNFWKQAVIF